MPFSKTWLRAEMDFSRAIGPWRDVFGLDQFRRVMREFRETWESARLEAHEVIEVGDHVVVATTTHMVGRDGIDVEARLTWTWTIRDGAIERACMFQERGEALETVGLSEQGAHADS
jgi:ketosteroid isomerase-like protein